MPNDYLNMTDEDFLKVNGPEKSEGETSQTKPVEETTSEKNAEEAVVETGEANENKSSDTNTDDASDKDASKSDTGTKSSTEDKSEEKPESKTEDTSSGSDEKNTEKAEGDKPKVEDKPIDYEAFYKQATTFKANGREIKLNSPEEVIRMLQKGAGYGRKMQEIAPHLKTIRMLEKNNLLDENKLSFLIDLDQKNPEAIKKLIKDSGIDPLEINTEDKVDYHPTNHSVSDAQYSFEEALKEVNALPQGKDTIRIINSTWDQTSKTLLWESPEILGVIQSQRENGLYDQIAAEIDRQKLLGTIPANEPFLKAYKVAGDYLVQQGNLKPKVDDPQNTEVLGTRTAQVKSTVSNSEKAKAASPTKSSARPATEKVNPLQMADDEFLKTFSGRL